MKLLFIAIAMCLFFSSCDDDDGDNKDDEKTHEDIIFPITPPCLIALDAICKPLEED